MSDIPEDILARSIDVWNRARAENSPDAIAEALMAERERCALIAEGNNSWPSEGADIAAEIRSPDNTEAENRP